MLSSAHPRVESLVGLAAVLDQPVSIGVPCQCSFHHIPRPQNEEFAFYKNESLMLFALHIHASLKTIIFSSDRGELTIKTAVKTKKNKKTP